MFVELSIAVLFPQINVMPLPTNLKVVKQGSDIYISYRYLRHTDMHLGIGKCGINNMMNIKAIYLDTNYSREISPWVTKRSVPFMEACSDWIGPYAVKSLENDDGGKFSFTGGWHGNKVNGKLEPTAKTENFTVEIDGKELVDNRVYDCESLEITATNYIQGYNTKKIKSYVLKEVVKYKITHNKVDIELVSTALEKVLLQRYYGLQTQDTSCKRIEYSNGISSVCGKDSDSGPYNKNNIANSLTLISKNNSYKIVASIETGYGLGNFENLQNDKPTIFTEEYGKTYFNMVNGIDKIINKGDSIKWKGSYEFK